MVSRPTLRRIGLLTLAGTLIACAHQPQPTAPNSAPPGGKSAFSISQLVAPDPSVFETVPDAIPMAEAAARLAEISLSQVSAAFQSDVYTGQPGMLRGFAPGFNAELFERSRFFRAGDMWIPYTMSEGQYLPLALVDRSTGTYFYPALLRVEGILVPVYHAVRRLLEPYSLAIPVAVPPTYVSPINIILVPAPILVRPIIIRPRPRPRPRPAPTARPPRPTPAPTARPPRPEPPRPRPRPPRPPRVFEPPPISQPLPDDLEDFPIVTPD